MTTLARAALLAARPYISAAANTGGGRAAQRVLKLIDDAMKELEPKKVVQMKPQDHQAWEPPGGWPDDAA